MKLLLNILSGLLALLGTITGLGYIPFLDAPIGLLIIALAGALYTATKLIGDYLDDKKLNDSFKESSLVKKLLDLLTKLLPAKKK